MPEIPDIRGRRPYIIAGPCSAESEQQLLDAYTGLAAAGRVDMVRAGVWKPRTNPGSFEGAGAQALEWLRRGRELTGIPFGVEVANAAHVRAALGAGADMVWIGARTSVSPFSVQEIAEALAGADVPVLVKNPMIADVDMWDGTVRRLVAAGVPQDNLVLVHRGFSRGGSGEGFRNPPVWHIALEMKRRYPDMAMLCDPSHICGRRETLAEVSQKAADLYYDGLMIESHCDPDAALSDARQQITPSALSALLDSLVWREAGTENSGFAEKLEKCRSEIDRIDSEIFALLARRMGIAEEIGHIKKDNNVTILQDRRWQEITERIVARAGELNLSPAFIREVLDAIHLESINHQNRVMNNRE